MTRRTDNPYRGYREPARAGRKGLIVGRCFACHEPVRAVEVCKLADPSVVASDGRPMMRLLHAGACADRFAVMTARVEGGMPDKS
jgi:hypothetical protein